MTSPNTGETLHGAGTAYLDAPSGGQAGQMAASAKEQAGQVAGSAREQAGEVAGTARDQVGAVAGTATDSARRVAGEAATQVRELTDHTRRQLTEQAEQQQQQLAGSLRSLAQELADMAAGRQGSDGIAGEVVREAAHRAQQAAEYLDERNPGELVEELRGLGRRRPGAFLAGAVVSGFLVGRFAKNAAAPLSQTREGSSETAAPKASDRVRQGDPVGTALPATGTTGAPFEPVPELYPQAAQPGRAGRADV